MTTQSATGMQRVKEAEHIIHSNDKIVNQSSRMADVIARRAFEIFESRGGLSGHDMEDWLRAESELLHPVLVNIIESNDEFLVRAEVPGLGSNNSEINVESRSLAISGGRETRDENENKRTILSESTADRIFRSLALLADDETSEVSIAVKDGILTVDLPKTQTEK